MATEIFATMTGHSLSIVAMGPTLSSYLQDFERDYRKPTDESWGINSVGVWLGDMMIDKIVAMDNFRRDLKEHGQYVRNLTQRGLPIITDVSDPRWPCAQAYPLERVLRDIWPDAKQDSDIIPPLTNSCAYALALGIAGGFSEIRLYGYEFRQSDGPALLYHEADKNSDKPYWWAYHMRDVVERRRDMEPGEPCVMFLIGVAHQRGIRIRIPKGSTLCDQDRGFYYYGYEKQPKPFESLM